MTHEVVTLQFGNYSNYVGAHYWNIQDNQFVYSTNYYNNKEIPDVNHDVLFREGITYQKNLTYTPRMILFDLKENVNIIKSVNQHYGSQKSKTLNWDGGIEFFESDKRHMSKYSLDLEKAELEEFENEVARKTTEKTAKLNRLIDNDYKMDEQVCYWSDYMKQKYHDRSYMLLNSSQTPKSNEESGEAFDLFTHGLDAYKEITFHERFEDNLRHFAEECDLIQGFQMFIDSFNGFGGLANKSLSFITEEFPKAAVFSFLSFPHHNEQDIDLAHLRLMNTSLTLRSLLEAKNDIVVLPLSLFNSFYTEKGGLKPIKLFSVDYKPNLSYHTSAILASLIDNVTLPWRQKSQLTLMSDLIELIDVYKYKIGSLQAVYPLNLDSNKYLFDYLQKTDIAQNSTHFTPMCSSHEFGETSSEINGALNVVCRGVQNKQVKNIKDNYYFKDIVAAHSVLDRYLVDMYPKSKSKSYSIEEPLHVNLPFPNIINDMANKIPQKEISLITNFQMNKKISSLLEFICKSIKTGNSGKLEKYYESYYEHDDFVELDIFNRDLCELYSV